MFKRELVKLCALCDTRIHHGDVVCHEHIAAMKQYHNETWFQEMVIAQLRQYEIDTIQRRSQMFGIKQAQDHIGTSPQRGKNLDRTTIQTILNYNKEGLGRNKIARLTGISTFTIGKLLRRYKKKVPK